MSSPEPKPENDKKFSPIEISYISTIVISFIMVILNIFYIKNDGPKSGDTLILFIPKIIYILYIGSSVLLVYTIINVYKKKKNKDKNWRRFELAALETYNLLLFLLIFLVILFVIGKMFKKDYEKNFVVGIVSSLFFLSCLIILIKFTLFISYYTINGTIKLINGTYFDDNKNNETEKT